jgi:lauroyl/myristoyl acyltransferase
MTRRLLHFDMVDDQMAEVFRAKSEAERLAIAHGMWKSASRMVRNVLRDEHPDWNDEHIQREAARRLSHGAV